MSEITAAPKAASFLSKKVFGIPVMYLALGAVLILAVFAWQMKAAPAAAADASGESASDTILSESETYPALPLGTVNGNGGEVEPAPVDLIDDNDEWLSRGVAFLVKKGKGPGEAQMALTLYLNGNDLSYEQGQMRDDVIRELGLPPYPGDVGKTGVDIARAQGPIPRDHVVKNQNENTPTKLAALYYGVATKERAWMIVNANGGKRIYPKGTVVHIPAAPKPTPPAKPVSGRTAPVANRTITTVHKTPESGGPVVMIPDPVLPGVRPKTIDGLH